MAALQASLTLSFSLSLNLSVSQNLHLSLSLCPMLGLTTLTWFYPTRP